MSRNEYRIAKVHICLLGGTLEWCRLELSRCLLEGLDTARTGACSETRSSRDGMLEIHGCSRRLTDFDMQASLLEIEKTSFRLMLQPNVGISI
jgi:hypothetical protein